ncbi:MAG: discoidin domain-containing protein [Mariprofundus sp.]|nr:discoidin domain-containing protein [Mariprofundus sp.]
MRKRIINQQQEIDTEAERDWLNVEAIASAELTSEDEVHPFESALAAGGSGWRAAEAGEQRLRLLFDAPQQISAIRLIFQEDNQERTQEFVLRYSSDKGETYHDIARQQYNFSRPDSMRQQEEYNVNLQAVTALELYIIPDISGASTCASLAEWRIA